MKEQVEQFLKSKEILTKDMKLWVVDQTIPLEERWEVFIQSGLGADSGYCEEFPGLDWTKICYHDDLRMEKYANRSVDSILEICLGDELFTTEEGEALYKEWCLKKFFSSITNDW